MQPLPLPLAADPVLPLPPSTSIPKKGEEKLQGEERCHKTAKQEQWIRTIVCGRPALVTPLSFQCWTMETMETEQGDDPHHSCSHA